MDQLCPQRPTQIGTDGRMRGIRRLSIFRLHEGSRGKEKRKLVKWGQGRVRDRMKPRMTRESNNVLYINR